MPPLFVLLNFQRAFLFTSVSVAFAFAIPAVSATAPAETPLKVLDLLPNPIWEQEKRNALANKYFEKAQELKTLGKYTDANYFFELTLEQDPEFRSSVEWERSEIFLRTGRKADAEHLLKKLVRKRHYEYEVVERYAKLLISDRRAGEAVQICQRLPNLHDDENSVVLLVIALKANGQTAKAIELAKVSYVRLARGEKTCGALKKFLNQNGVKFKLPYDTSQNLAVLKIVKQIANLKKPISAEQLAMIFTTRDRERSWGRRSQGATCIACTANPMQLRLGNEEPNSSAIRILPDAQKTCITRSEVEKVFGKTQMKPALWGMHGKGISARLEYFERDPILRFLFSDSTPGESDRIQHVTQIQISWKAGRLPEPPQITYVPPNPVPRDQIELHISLAESAFRDTDYRRGATLLMKYWQEDYGTARSTYANYVRRKKLLFDCYQKLGRNDIAEVVKVADYATLSLYVDRAFGFSTLLLPTMDEYMKERWKATGGSDGQISIHSPGWLITGVERDSPLYSEFVRSIGTLNDGEEREIAPLPARLIDPTWFDRASE